jgi:hypothetical protein
MRVVTGSDVWFLWTVLSQVTSFFTTHALKLCEINFIIFNSIFINVSSLMLASFASFIIEALLATAPPELATILRLMSFTTPSEIIFFFVIFMAVLACFNFQVNFAHFLCFL